MISKLISANLFRKSSIPLFSLTRKPQFDFSKIIRLPDSLTKGGKGFTEDANGYFSIWFEEGLQKSREGDVEGSLQAFNNSLDYKDDLSGDKDELMDDGI